ncbi:MAG: hypothetical protein PWP60_577 [Candidatus Atribacteria bacterium]|uniref:SpoIIE family protein phosphatase n=1 Tax=Atrimonas thermophila TaxID=3064161 RepID=UPI0024AC7782|nr:hypothetical protein [Candidatus Atribacteria bacterium]
MEELFVEVGSAQIPKYGEELCGDSIAYHKGPKSTIIVWSDGLGSGVKASILSTLTSKIIVTMLCEETPLEEVVQTLADTLPVCRVRKIAYSTFSVLHIKKNGDTHLVEFDNPEIFWIRNGRLMYIERVERKMGKMTIREANFRLQKGDWIVGVSDGVVHAGIGGKWNLGWQWEKIASFLEITVTPHLSASSLAQRVIDTTLKLYDAKPGDDATCVVAKIRLPNRVVLWAGPPENPSFDSVVFEKFITYPGKKVVCGGTTGNIVSRLLGQEIKVDLESLSPEIPPVGILEGVDLVTEGVLTLSRVLKLFRENVDPEKLLSRQDGASRLYRLLCEADEIKIIGGKAINPAHQNPKLSGELSLKVRILEELEEELRKHGKMVSSEFY